MSVPKAPVNKHRYPRPDENYVRSSGEVLAVKAIPKTNTMQRLPEIQFRLGMSLSNSRHHGRPLCFGNDIGQKATLPSAKDRGFEPQSLSMTPKGVPVQPEPPPGHAPPGPAIRPRRDRADHPRH